MKTKTSSKDYRKLVVLTPQEKKKYIMPEDRDYEILYNRDSDKGLRHSRGGCKMILNVIVKCVQCGTLNSTEVNPAAIMGAKPKTMTEAAMTQRKNAAITREESRRNERDIKKNYGDKIEKVSRMAKKKGG